MTKKQTMKKGITLIEIILAIVLIAIILGITIPKLMANSARAEIKAVISSDVKSIIESASLWRKSTVAAQGSFNSLSSSKLNSRLPNTMTVVGSSQVIMSSGLKTGLNGSPATDISGVRYVVQWSFSPPVLGGTPVRSLAIAIDTTLADQELQWDGKLVSYAKEVFDNTVAEVSDGGTAHITDFTPHSGFANGTVAVGTANGDAFSLACSDSKVSCLNTVILKN